MTVQSNTHGKKLALLIHTHYCNQNLSTQLFKHIFLRLICTR